MLNNNPECKAWRGRLCSNNDYYFNCGFSDSFLYESWWWKITENNFCDSLNGFLIDCDRLCFKRNRLETLKKNKTLRVKKRLYGRKDR